MSDIVGFKEVQEEENKVIAKGRHACYPKDDTQGTKSTFGLAFSGGGIRSATFNLGVLQGLAEAKLLKRLDYLSTVSGGGYIGSWFSALLHRKADKRDETAAEDKVAAALDELHDELAPNSQTTHQAGKASPNGQSAIKWLRRYSSYLTPRYGLFSLDTLAALAGLFRNLLLTQTILVCLLTTTLLIPYLLMDAGRGIATYRELFPLWALAALALTGLLFALVLVQQRMSQDDRDALPAIMAVLYASCVAALIFYLCRRFPEEVSLPFGVLCAGVGAFYLLAWLVFPYCKDLAAKKWALIPGIAFALMLFGYSKALEHVDPDLLGAFSLVVGPPIIMQIVATTAILHIGLVGRDFTDIAREWLSRAGGQIIALDLVWITITALSLFAPAMVSYSDAWVHYSGGVAWVLISFASFWLARSDKTGGKNANPLLEKALIAAPYLVILGLFILLSYGLHQSLTDPLGTTSPHTESEKNKKYDVITLTIKDKKPDTVEVTPAEEKPTLHKNVDATLQQNAQVDAVKLAGALAILMGVGLLLALRIDINVFSMHQFYRLRLTRAYLGASNNNRKRNSFNDFDKDDDLALSALANQRPIHLLNSTLNLTSISKKDLQWQERRGVSFIFSPCYCGYQLPPKEEKGIEPVKGYCLTSEYFRLPPNQIEGLPLGTAVAVSGAAASPNMGYHSSKPLAFLMTFFNVRLGRWSPNPGSQGRVHLPSPRFALMYLIKELFGFSDETTRFINLTDGGHFDNLGVYELVRRKCKLILVSDAEADNMNDFKFEALGHVIHKCRVDFGVEIVMHNMDDLLPKNATSRFACGWIKYDNNEVNDGVLIYIKPLLCGKEPVDVRHYAATHEDFPHQSTSDQWFDESQFESYRELGLISVRAMLERLDVNRDIPDMSARKFVEKIKKGCDNSDPHQGKPA